MGSGGARNFNLDPRTGCVSLVFVLIFVVSAGGPDILLTKDSVRLVHVLLFSVQVHNLAPPRGIRPGVSVTLRCVARACGPVSVRGIYF